MLPEKKKLGVPGQQQIEVLRYKDKSGSYHTICIGQFNVKLTHKIFSIF